jgi:hypothetical protein
MEPLWIALGIGFVATLIGWGLARVSRPRGAIGLSLIGLGGVVALWVAGRQAQGWDAIGYAIGAFLLLGPAALGCALGGGVEWLLRRRAMRGRA